MTTKNFRKILEVDSEEKVNKRSGQTSMLGTIWGKNSPFDTMGFFPITLNIPLLALN